MAYSTLSPNFEHNEILVENYICWLLPSVKDSQWNPEKVPKCQKILESSHEVLANALNVSHSADFFEAHFPDSQVVSFHKFLTDSHDICKFFTDSQR